MTTFDNLVFEKSLFQAEEALEFYELDEEYDPPLKEDEMIDLDEPIPF